MAIERKCPECGEAATLEHFRTHPDCSTHVRSLAAILFRSRRTKEGGGRKRSTDRCLCGEFTLNRALSRNFDCCRKVEPSDLVDEYRLLVLKQKHVDIVSTEEYSSVK